MGHHRATLPGDARMTGWEMVAVAAAGFAAGGINAVVGSGTLVTFPVLLAVGLPPVTATVSNSLGLVPGNLTGAIGYRRELAGQRWLLLRLLPASVLGALTGAFLLLHLPASSFEAIVPVLIGLAVVLVAVQPADRSGRSRTRRPRRRRRRQHDRPGPAGRPVRRRLRDRHLRRLLRRQPGRAADRHLRAAAAGVPAAAQRDQERADDRGQRRRGGRLRRGRDRPGRLAGVRPHRRRRDPRRLHSAPGSAGGCRRRSCGRRSSSSGSSRSRCC